MIGILLALLFIVLIFVALILRGASNISRINKMDFNKIIRESLYRKIPLECVWELKRTDNDFNFKLVNYMTDDFVTSTIKYDPKIRNSKVEFYKNVKNQSKALAQAYVKTNKIDFNKIIRESLYRKIPLECVWELKRTDNDFNFKLVNYMTDDFVTSTIKYDPKIRNSKVEFYKNVKNQSKALAQAYVKTKEIGDSYGGIYSSDS